MLSPYFMQLKPIKKVYYILNLNGDHKRIAPKLCHEMTETERLWISVKENSRDSIFWWFLSSEGMITVGIATTVWYPIAMKIRSF